MADMLTVEEVADAMFKIVEEAQGKKKLKPQDLKKMVRAQFEGRVDRKSEKLAIKQLIDSGRCVYTYYGGSFIEIPHKEGASND
jgi:hypothetical protein